MLMEHVKRLTWTSCCLPKKHLLFRCPGGKFFWNVAEPRGLVLRGAGVYEYWKTRLMLHVVKENMVVVDVGVNKGYFSLLFAKLLNGKGKVLSFEADPENCFWFWNSVRANKYGNVKLFNYALSDAEGEAMFYRGKKSGWGSLISSPSTLASTFTVTTRRMDNVFAEEHIDRLDVMKVDVQGAERQVLEGAKETLRKHDVKLLMDVDSRDKRDWRAILRLLDDCGFHVYTIGKKPREITMKLMENTKELFAFKRLASHSSTFGKK